jgi:CubicO group peptidase (beta-lactamase class C family)
MRGVGCLRDMLMPRLFCTALILLAPATVAAQSSAAIDSLITREMRQRRIPGVSYAVVDDGKVVLKKAYGFGNLETEMPLTVNSVFELASVTKQFTAAGIMLLVEDGKVKLDEPINNYFEPPIALWQGITVRQLLTHTAGLQSGGVVNHQGSPLMYISTKQAYEMISTRPLFMQPGTHGFYADAGYFLLGMIIEKASGMPYRTFLQRRIFDPLEMSQSSVLDKRRVLKGRVATYEFLSGNAPPGAPRPNVNDDTLVNWRRDWQYELPSFFGIFSTLDDLAKWSTSLHRHSLLKQESLEQMWTPAKLTNGGHAMVIGDLYGFGFLLSDVRGHRYAGHGGASGTFILHFLDAPISVIVLSNLSSTAGRHAPMLARAIAGLYRTEYQLVNRLGVTQDLPHELHAAVAATLPEYAAGRTTNFMTDAHRAYFNDMPAGFRNRLNEPLGKVTGLALITCDNVEGRGIRYTNPVARICHFKGEGGPQPIYISVYLTKDGKAAHLTFE